jgi:hypothetical protein
MGVTIHYRGRLADLSLIEEFEDLVIDFALEIGGEARIWRTWADDNPDRMVRGVILNLAEGHESTSLLVAPEGWLINLTEIEDAEVGRLIEPPWCFVKTQFGPVEGHVAFVEMFAALKREFLPDLEVSDDGGYWETRDFDALVRNRAFTQAAIDGLGAGLRRYGLSSEAAEDPDILTRHIERVAELVHRNLHQTAEWAAAALQDLDELRGAAGPESRETPSDESLKDRSATDGSEGHHLLNRASNLLARLVTLFRDRDPQSDHSLKTLYRGARDITVGLARALAKHDHDADHYRVHADQFKRALRGAAFARGARYPLRSILGSEHFGELNRTVEQLETDILSELCNFRSKRAKDVAHCDRIRSGRRLGARLDTGDSAPSRIADGRA